MILAHLQNLPKNVGDLGKLVVAKGFKKLPKVQKIAKSGHTAQECLDLNYRSQYKVACAAALPTGCDRCI